MKLFIYYHRSVSSLNFFRSLQERKYVPKVRSKCLLYAVEEFNCVKPSREFFMIVTLAVTRRATCTCEVNTHARKTLEPRCVGGKMLLIAYAVDISATDGATMRNNEAIINESRLTVVREYIRALEGKMFQRISHKIIMRDYYKRKKISYFFHY